MMIFCLLCLLLLVDEVIIIYHIEKCVYFYNTRKK